MGSPMEGACWSPSLSPLHRFMHMLPTHSFCKTIVQFIVCTNVSALGASPPNPSHASAHTLSGPQTFPTSQLHAFAPATPSACHALLLSQPASYSPFQAVSDVLPCAPRINT